MKFNHLIPLLDVKNIDKSIRFYRDALGFSVEDKLIWNGRIDWVLLRSGKVEIMLSESQDAPSRLFQTSSANIFFFYIDDPDDLYNALESKGYEIANVQWGLQGVKEFCLQDPDGHVLWFSPRTERQKNIQLQESA